MRKLLLACIAACLLLPATAQATAPTLTKAGSVLSWSAVSGATKYQIGLWYVSPSKCTSVEPCFTQSTTATTFNENEILSGWTYAFEVREKEPVVGEWSNRVEITYPVVEEDSGHVAYMWDWASWANSYTGFGGSGPLNVEWFSSRASYARAYPPSDNAYPGWFPAIAFQGYRDWYLEKRNLWEAGPREGYEALVAGDISHGFKGPWIDDMEFASGFDKVGTDQAKWNEGELRTTEGIRAKYPSAPIEMNTQYHDLWPRIKEANVTVLKVLELVNSVFLERGWGPGGGISTAADYRESLEYVDWLHAHGKALTLGWDYEHNDIATEEYSLATLLLATKLGDHVDYYHQHPPPEELWAHLFNMDLGEPLGARTRTAAGVWERDFSKGRAYTAEPGVVGEQHITLPESLENSKGEHVTSVTLKAGQGAVLAK